MGRKSSTFLFIGCIEHREHSFSEYRKREKPMIQRFLRGNIRKNPCFHNKKHRPPASMGRGTAHVHATGISFHVAYIITLKRNKNKLYNKKVIWLLKWFIISVSFSSFASETGERRSRPFSYNGKRLRPGCGR